MMIFCGYLSLFLIILLSSNVESQRAKNNLNVTYKPDGSYNILVNDKVWLQSANTFMRHNKTRYDTYSRTLSLKNITNVQGIDVLGSWKAVVFTYALNDNLSVTMNCNILMYEDIDMIRFIQEFPNGGKDTAVPNDHNTILSSFPSFKIQAVENEKVGYLSYGGMMGGDLEKVLGDLSERYPMLNSGAAAGPLVLFNSKGDTLVLSQMTEFMSTSVHHDFSDKSYNFGIMSGVNDIPEKFVCDFVVYYSDVGVNKAMEGWGKNLQIFHGKDLSYKLNDITQNYLSYWTDNGAYYYFLTENNKTYQQTILDIIEFNKQAKIPFRTIQYDSWWYNRRYAHGAVVWDGNVATEAFPDSMQYVFNITKQFVTGHNKFWDSAVAYAKQNGGDYNFIIDDKNFKSLPNDQKFWDDLFKNATKWGLKTYEQDWMDSQTLEFEPLRNNISLGKKWLKDMGDAALKNGISIQYCMSLSRHILQSLEIKAVTQARVSNDYMTNWNYGGEQWRIGISSILSSSVGLSPFKDVYWSMSEQPGNKNGNIPNGKAHEPFVELNSVTAILSGGPVGVGDKIGLNTTNRTLIMRSCNDEGLLLKPTKGFTAIDQSIHFKALGNGYGINGEVGSAYSTINNFTYGILFAADVREEYKMVPYNLGFIAGDNSYFWKDGNSDTIYNFNKDSLIIDKECSKKEFCLYHVSPCFNLNGQKVALIGEQSKWVPVSPNRILKIIAEDLRFQVELQGVANEIVTFSLMINEELKKINCNFVSDGQMNIVVSLNQNISADCF